MKISLTRYHQSPTLTRSHFLAQLDTIPADTLRCEAREPGYAAPSTTQGTHAPHPLPLGTYRCAVASSDVSPMSVRVCRPRGTYRTIIGYHPLRQWRNGMITLGQADPGQPPEERAIDRQQETFEAFTALVYRAFALGESITLTVDEQEPNKTCINVCSA